MMSISKIRSESRSRRYWTTIFYFFLIVIIITNILDHATTYAGVTMFGFKELNPLVERLTWTDEGMYIMLGMKSLVIGALFLLKKPFVQMMCHPTIWGKILGFIFLNLMIFTAMMGINIVISNHDLLCRAIPSYPFCEVLY